MLNPTVLTAQSVVNQWLSAWGPQIVGVLSSIGVLVGVALILIGFIKSPHDMGKVKNGAITAVVCAIVGIAGYVAMVQFFRKTADGNGVATNYGGSSTF